MPVDQMLASMNSQVIAEYMVVENWEYWEKRLAEKKQQNMSSEEQMRLMFGKQIAEGTVEWQQPQK